MAWKQRAGLHSNQQKPMTKETTRTTLDRNPDVNLDKEAIPAGMHLVKGKKLMIRARYAKIPYGVATRVIKAANSRDNKVLTVGLILRPEHVQPFLAAQAAHEAKKNG